MPKKIAPLILLFALLTSFLITNPALYASGITEYLCELGITFYRIGRYDEALMEFKKALMVEPDNKTAKEYINKVFQRGRPTVTLPKRETSPAHAVKPPMPKAPKAKLGVKPEAVKGPSRQLKSKAVKPPELPRKTAKTPQPLTESAKKEPAQKAEKEKAISAALDKMSKAEAAFAKKPSDSFQKEPPATLSGEYRLSLGATSKDIIWKDTNADKIGIPREKNWRYLWGEQRHNTYDPKIYDRLTLDMQTQFDNPFNSFMEITADPWSFIGKNHVSISSTAGGDTVDMDLKYWSADSRTINEVYRSRKGNIINLKQVKVGDGKTTVTTPTGITDWATTFNPIEPMEINRDYRLIRKLWFDYKQDDYALKFFPLSDDSEALTSDDPLRISNNRVYWEESPWLDEYEPSRIFEPDSGTFPLKKGRWIRRLSFFARDSSDEGARRLTFLRGASFKADTGAYSFETAVATPMSLWDEYYRANSVDAAARFKAPLSDDLQIGVTLTSKAGLNGGSTEALNQTGALDLSYGLSSHNTIYGEVAGSYTDIQEAKGFDTTYDGRAVKLGFNYDAAKEKTKGIYKNEIYLAHMDNKFYPALSNYRYTRRDEPTFSRHIYFAESKEEDKALIFGDGIDRGRNVAGFKLNAKYFTEKLDTDIKYRNVHKDNGKYVESVMRAESTFKASPDSKLTSKLLTYYKHLPKTHARYDPLIYAKTMYSLTDYFSEEDIYAENTSIIDNKDPSVGAFGWGGKYDFSEQVSLEGIYERTNDPLDFPRGLLNDTYVTTEMKDGIVYDKVVPFLYDQNFFDLPPYRYYNIAKSRLIYTPGKEWEFILGYAFNENKHASGIDDNINHFRLEANYIPSDKLTFWFKYIYSRLIDVYKQNKERRSDFYEGHHNAFFGSEYLLNKDESFTLLYGEFVGYNDPYQQTNFTLSALDTQHIFRLFYKRKF